MREAQKMMQDPAFQEHMKKMTQAPAFQAHMKNTQEMLKDPKKVSFLVQGHCKGEFFGPLFISLITLVSLPLVVQ
jgi:hypothetical protein